MLCCSEQELPINIFRQFFQAIKDIKIMINKVLTSVSISGIDITAFDSIKQAAELIISDEGHVLSGVAVALNPEKILQLRKNPTIESFIVNASIRYADGFGVSYVMSNKLRKSVTRIPGCELWEAVMIRSSIKKIPVYILGSTDEVVEMTKTTLESSGVNVVGARNGYFNDDEQEQIINLIKTSGAKIITVAMGSPKQELFINHCVKTMPQLFYMGVGGTYDVFTGNVKRAPLLFRYFNCEWLYRLLSQPTRISRQLNLLKYFLLFIKNKL
jgi:UDP-N-acetyl-D-mannosaminouronate:lipid I N-acetyl-D-mannosaminouronosyltransferase